MNKITAAAVLVVLVVAGYMLYKVKPQPVAMPDLYATESPTPSSLPLTSLEPTVMPTSLSGQPLSLSDVKPVNTTVHVTLKTSKGDIKMDLDGAKAPLAVGNFVYLANQHFYDGVTFHRVIPDFMVQAGDPLSKDPNSQAVGTGGPGYVFQNEANDRKFVRGSLGMANAGPDTNGSQFFIVTGAAFPDLDGGYTNFGTVTAGMDVADAISQVQRDGNDKPLQPVTIQSVVIEN